MIRLMLVDDHTILRQGLAQMLAAQPDLEVIAQAGSGADALERAAQTCPDVVLLDIHMPGMDGVEVTRRLKARCPQAAILILTMYRNESLLMQAIQAGASGYLLKEAELDTLLQAIRALAAGQSYLDQAVTPAVLKRLRPGGESPAPVKLSADEVELLRLLVLGWSNRQIAGQFGLAEKTVRNRLTRLFRKLGVANRSAAIHYALRHNLIDPDIT